MPFDIPLITVVILVAFVVLLRDVARRFRNAKRTALVDPGKRKKRRGPDMAFSAGRDAAQQNARLQQVFIPMEPEEEPALRAFYLQTLGLMEMRSPNYPEGLDGFWAVSGARQIYFGTQPTFNFDTEALPSFPIQNIDGVAQTLAAAGYETAWDQTTPYIRKLIVVDPAGTQIALIAA
ncbi:MAG: hypothetical protein AAGF56_05465 [Pseudomonadota bacterium]